MLEINKIHQGDCLELMKQIDDKSIDMVLCDLPYGTTACIWDEIIPLQDLWDEYKRIIKIDGVIILTASQPFTSILVCSNINWFSHSWIWEKEQGVNFLMAKKMPLKIHEDILVFFKPDSYDLDSFIELKNIFRDILQKIGKKRSRIIKDLGQGLDHCFRWDSLQWGLPTKSNYEKLITYYNLEGVLNYSYLKALYQKEFKGRNKKYNPQKTFGSPYISGKGDSGEVTGNIKKVQTINNGERLPTTILRFKRETGFHPTQKPVTLFEYLIKTYTNERDLILDNCIGSGTTAMACKNTNRNFIGIEKEKQYVDIANKRLSQKTMQEMSANSSQQ